MEIMFLLGRDGVPHLRLLYYVFFFIGSESRRIVSHSLARVEQCKEQLSGRDPCSSSSAPG